MKGKLKLLKTRGGKLYHSYHYTTDNVLMYQPRNAEPRIFIPTAALRARLLREVHDAGGHYGRDLTYLKLTDRFYWPKMFIDAQTYTADCLVCQRNRARNRPPAGHIDPLTIPQQRWRDITMDIIPGLPTTQAGYDAIWTIVDRMTRRAHFIPIVLTMDAEEAARIFFDVYYRLHGIPQSIVSDREPRWLNLFWSEVLRRTGTTLNTTVAYRPQADGLSERYNRTVESYLRHYVNFEQTDWDQHLSTAEYTINATVNSAIGCAPFELDLGYVPAAPIDTVLPPNNNDARTLRGAHFINRLEALRIRCRDQLLQAQERMRHNANRGIDDLQFAVGDQVLLEVSRINPAHLPSHRKLGPRRIGPYRILRKIGAKAYKLNLPTGCRLHPVFDVDSLTPYRIAQRAQSAIPTMLEDGTEGYLVERIIGRRIHRGVVQYQVKWLGPADDITWEPVENLRGVPDAITEFHNSAPNVHNQRPRRRRRRT